VWRINREGERLDEGSTEVKTMRESGWKWRKGGKEEVRERQIERSRERNREL
jgi:hypothetical protein